MRSHGLRLEPSAPELHDFSRGWLEFKRTPLDSYGPRMEAHLLDQRGGKDVIRPLYFARLVRIDGVMHLAGLEREGRTNTKASTRPVKQSWLCVLDPAEAAPILNRVHIKRASGFAEDDPNDDPFAPLNHE